MRLMSPNFPIGRENARFYIQIIRHLSIVAIICLVNILYPSTIQGDTFFSLNQIQFYSLTVIFQCNLLFHVRKTKIILLILMEHC